MQQANSNIFPNEFFGSIICATPKRRDVRYVIVKGNGETLEFVPNLPPTPRELVNIIQFFSAISAVAASAVAAKTFAPAQMNWEELIKNLGIERHFSPGRAKDAYSSDGDVLYVLLKSAG